MGSTLVGVTRLAYWWGIALAAVRLLLSYGSHLRTAGSAPGFPPWMSFFGLVFWGWAVYSRFSFLFWGSGFRSLVSSFCFTGFVFTGFSGCSASALGFCLGTGAQLDRGGHAVPGMQ